MTKDQTSELKKTLLDVFNSQEGQTAMSKAALDALKSKEADEFLLDFFMKAFREVILPGLDNLQEDTNQLKEDVSDIREDVSYLRTKTAKSDKFVQDLREKILTRGT